MQAILRLCLAERLGEAFVYKLRFCLPKFKILKMRFAVIRDAFLDVFLG